MKSRTNVTGIICVCLLIWILTGRLVPLNIACARLSDYGDSQKSSLPFYSFFCYFCHLHGLLGDVCTQATDCEPGTGITKHNGAETTFIMGTGTCSCTTPNTSEILVPLGVSFKIPDNLLPRAGVCHDIFVCGLFTRPRMTYVYCSSAQNMLFE